MQGLTVSPSPHINKFVTTQKVMLMVLIALLPAVVASGIIFGPRAILVIAVSAVSAVLWEFIARIVMRKENTISDLSAAVTGVLLAMNLPVTIPLWMVVLGTFIAIVIVKQLFGGLGQNFANPAIVARIVLLISFGAQMTTWVKPYYYKNGYDLTTSATPLLSSTGVSYKDLFLGNVGGSLGETCALALLIGGLFLVLTRVISPSTPLAFIGSLALFSFISGGDPLYDILAGGVMLGAIFMATDYVTTPITNMGKIIFGIGCGFITFAIRKWANMPEGTSFAILLMNIVTPYIDMVTKTHPVGGGVKLKKAKKALKEAKIELSLAKNELSKAEKLLKKAKKKSSTDIEKLAVEVETLKSKLSEAKSAVKEAKKILKEVKNHER